MNFLGYYDLGIFEVTFIILQLLFMTIKIYMTGKHSPKATNANDYPVSIGIFQGIHALILLLPFMWAFGFFDYSFLVLKFPIFIRDLGVICYFFLILGMIWQMQELSVNISASHTNRHLVTSGPYQYIRHPLYLVFVLMMFAGWLISSNWVFFLAIFPSLLASIIRADYEEKLLLDEYKDEYIRYQQNTGQFLPKL